MKVTLIGAGCGRDTWTAGALEALEKAELILGPNRLLEDLPDCDGARFPAYRPEDILNLLRDSEAETACVLLSGDSGFYSGAAKLLPMLRSAGMEPLILPGISCVQLLAARLERPWQEWRLCSAHGVECDPIYEVMQGTPALFLTSDENGPGELCRRLLEAGLGNLRVTVGERLGLPGERIIRASAGDLAGRRFARLNVLLAEAAPCFPRRTPGLPDDAFLRDQVPMTKQEVRALALAKLAVKPQDLCWDIGTGTGSVGVELAMQAQAVWAVERNPEALELARKNRERMCAWNLRLVSGTAPEALEDLPKPDAVFLGGSGGRLEEILEAVHRANPQGRICVSAIALETLRRATETMERLGYETEITQVSVSRAKPAGGLHLLMARNPVFLISGRKP